jgi:hypothetical protein
MIQLKIVARGTLEAKNTVLSLLDYAPRLELVKIELDNFVRFKDEKIYIIQVDEKYNRGKKTIM